MAEKGPTTHTRPRQIYPGRIVNLSCVLWVWPVYLCLWPHSSPRRPVSLSGWGEPTVGRDSGVLFYSLLPWKRPQWNCSNKALPNAYKACQAVRISIWDLLPGYMQNKDFQDGVHIGRNGSIYIVVFKTESMCWLGGIRLTKCVTVDKYLFWNNGPYVYHSYIFAGADGGGILGSLLSYFSIFMTAHQPPVYDPGLNCTGTTEKMLNCREHVYECYFTCCVRKEHNK